MELKPFYRGCPVLVGEEAEEFLDRWEDSLKKPLKNKPTPEEIRKIDEMIANSRKNGWL